MSGGSSRFPKPFDSSSAARLQTQVASRLWDYHFTESDAADRLRGYFLNLLETDLAGRTPEQINLLVSWSLSGRIELLQPLDGRKQLVATEIPDSICERLPTNSTVAGKTHPTRAGNRWTSTRRTNIC